MLEMRVTVKGVEIAVAAREADELIAELIDRYDFLSEDLEELQAKIRTIAEAVQFED